MFVDFLMEIPKKLPVIYCTPSGNIRISNVSRILSEMNELGKLPEDYRMRYCESKHVVNEDGSFSMCWRLFGFEFYDAVGGWRCFIPLFHAFLMPEDE